MEASRLTPEEVKRRLDSGEDIIFIDTRNPQAWGSSDQKIAGAMRVPLAEAEKYLGEIPRQGTIITYCT